MISKMNKLTVLVYHKEYEEFLVGLRNAGVVHVAEKNSGAAVTPELQAMLAEYARCEKLIKRLEAIASNNSVHAGGCENAQAVEEKCETLFKRQEKLLQDKLGVEKDIATMQVWGDFDNSMFDKLAAAGYAIRFYQVQEQSFNPEWCELYNAVVINKVSSKCYFVTVTAKDADFEIEAETARLSSSSLGKLKAELDEISAESRSGRPGRALVGRRVTAEQTVPSEETGGGPRCVQGLFQSLPSICQSHRMGWGGYALAGY